MNNIVIFDTETSGLSPKTGHRIIEIGAVAMSGSEITGEFQSLIDTDCEISWRATNVHGITNRMLKGEPSPFQVFTDFRDFIGAATLVAHNAPFDLRFLEFEFAALGFRLTNRSHCTLRLSRKIWPQLENHKLDTVARHVGASFDGLQQHRALDDAKVTAEIWRQMLMHKNFPLAV
ncbi:MAG: 3'-5' exonuclease [Desulfuromonadales bacterium]|nr:3'-5' exonuclease [Desulfuromonadales bacterium]